ncbi:ShlB/FhaC/HecB family hemolysin secretion/activation protein [Palleronia sp. KMU-117]|uniref:ShlB/FhaC/HecB family hemolysin secretion/activation protein n=1 Tax=Palleronia sp. KMU-117 TaxID=3434108 RepID=UPI003D72AA45
MGVRRALLFLVLVEAANPGAQAQSFFGSVGIENAVGVERGSTALVAPVDVPTALFTLDSFGSEDVGPWVSSLTFALPGVITATDQLDVTAVVAGPGEVARDELRAAGLGYRLRPWDAETTLYFTASFAEVTPDGTLTGPLSIDGSRRLLGVGVRRSIETDDAITDYVLEFRARESKGRSFRTPVLDERIAAVFLGVRRATGQPFEVQTRLGAAVSAGVAEFGDSMPSGVLASVPGAAEQFLRASASAEASVPLSPVLAINAGVVGQWSSAPLTVSQRCGFGTNAYSRGFDQSEILGDICLSGRVELAANAFLPSSDGSSLWLQPYAGIDGGYFQNLATRFFGTSTGDWSSASIGLRALGADWIGEIALTSIFIAPPIAISMSGEERLWLRAGLRF